MKKLIISKTQAKMLKENIMSENDNNDDIDNLIAMLHNKKKDTDLYIHGVSAIIDKYGKSFWETELNTFRLQLGKWMNDDEASTKIPEVAIEEYEWAIDNFNQMITEGDSDKDKQASKYDKIKSTLSNDIFNHAAIIKRLWGSKDATNRSLFAKKLNKKTDSTTGYKYEFTDDELTKIASILSSASASAGKN
jgi:hypothetical protein